MSLLVCRSLHKSFDGQPVLPPTDLHLAPGSLTVLIGESGCGKSTLLRLLAGLLPPDGGAILLDGRPCVGPGPERLLLFQEDTLFPWLSVAENVGFGLRASGLPAAERRERVARLLDAVGLAEKAEALPSALSGGMRQRAALARALAPRPRLLLLDEPFAALDALTRGRMQRLLLELRAQSGQTMLLVTHDVDEACLLADEVHVLAAGRGIVSSCSLPFPQPRAPEDPQLAAARSTLRRLLADSVER